MSIERKKPVPSDIVIAQAAHIKPITEIAKDYGIAETYIDRYGSYKAKVKLGIPQG
ncbi:hypothetical protein MASR2M48_17380 [Spirochaetota bacterium]